jgi:hypothetical protein
MVVPERQDLLTARDALPVSVQSGLAGMAYGLLPRNEGGG